MRISERFVMYCVLIIACPLVSIVILFILFIYSLLLLSYFN